MKNSEQPNEHHFRLEFQKMKPKKNAKVYEFQTVGEIFDAMENVKMFNKFVKEFKHGMIAGIVMRESIIATNPECAKFPIRLDKFTWTND